MPDIHEMLRVSSCYYIAFQISEREITGHLAVGTEKWMEARNLHQAEIGFG